MEIFLVGGAVRDKLLGLPVLERDWVVVGATPQQLLALGYRQVGKDFPVFLHPETGEEYALARTERKVAPGYRGFEFHADPGVTLEEDLQRRDLTINAIAENSAGELIDPYRGQEDLAAGRLRHVSQAFAEDPVRILRVARFAARFGKWGFSVAHGTNKLMRRMVADGEVDHLVAERVWAELAKALVTDTPERFFSVLYGCDALAALFPEIEREYAGRPADHQRKDLPAALVALAEAARHSDDPQVRLATLLASLGSGLTTAARLEQAEHLCGRYRLPNAYTQLALDVIRLAERADGCGAHRALEMMQGTGAFRDAGRWEQLLVVLRLLGRIDQTEADALDRARRAAARVTAASVAAPGLEGPALGQAIADRRRQVIETLLTARDAPERRPDGNPDH
jgi:tRNA nucleotidyltransferase (CCA-adding enzyme)